MNWGPLTVHKEIKISEYRRDGCPYCHHDKGYYLVQTPRKVVWQCICGHNLVIHLQEGEELEEE